MDGSDGVLYTRGKFDSIRVYPRTHGETTANPKRHANGRGLSPYTRGKTLFQRYQGSIPVHTGKPRLMACVRGRGGSIPVHTGKPGNRYFA